jgi:hypothetical protein
MRRERIILFVGALVAALAVGAPTAAAATPAEICQALKEGKTITVTPAEMAAFLKDPSVQVYGCSPTTQTPAGPTAPTPVTPAAPQQPTPTPTVVTPPSAAGPTPPVAEVAPTVVLPTVLPTGNVAGEQETKTGTPATPKKPGAGVKPASKTVAGNVAPLAQTKKTGSLPFTGAELGLFALVGGILIASGLALRFTARQRSRA